MLNGCIASKLSQCGQEASNSSGCSEISFIAGVLLFNVDSGCKVKVSFVAYGKTLYTFVAFALSDSKSSESEEPANSSFQNIHACRNG